MSSYQRAFDLKHCSSFLTPSPSKNSNCFFLPTFKVLKNEIILRVIIFLTGSLSFIKSYFLSSVTPAPFPRHFLFNSAGIKSSHLEKKIAILAYPKKPNGKESKKKRQKRIKKLLKSLKGAKNKDH